MISPTNLVSIRALNKATTGRQSLNFMSVIGSACLTSEFFETVSLPRNGSHYGITHKIYAYEATMWKNDIFFNENIHSCIIQNYFIGADLDKSQAVRVGSITHWKIRKYPVPSTRAKA